ncbi:uncharacterized protein O3C94_018965 [Discoglossus pictus]
MDFLQRHLPRLYQAVQSALDYINNVAAQVFGAPENVPRPQNTATKVAVSSSEPKTCSESPPSASNAPQVTETPEFSLEHVEDTAHCLDKEEIPPDIDSEESHTGTTKQHIQETDLRNRKTKDRTSRDQTHDNVLQSDLQVVVEKTMDLESTSQRCRKEVRFNLENTDEDETQGMLDERPLPDLKGYTESSISEGHPQESDLSPGDIESMSFPISDLESFAKSVFEELLVKVEHRTSEHQEEIINPQAITTETEEENTATDKKSEILDVKSREVEIAMSSKLMDEDENKEDVTVSLEHRENAIIPELYPVHQGEDGNENTKETSDMSTVPKQELTEESRCLKNIPESTHLDQGKFNQNKTNEEYLPEDNLAVDERDPPFQDLEPIKKSTLDVKTPLTFEVQKSSLVSVQFIESDQTIDQKLQSSKKSIQDQEEFKIRKEEVESILQQDHSTNQHEEGHVQEPSHIVASGSAETYLTKEKERDARELQKTVWYDDYHRDKDDEVCGSVKDDSHTLPEQIPNLKSDQINYVEEAGEKRDKEWSESTDHTEQMDRLLEDCSSSLVVNEETSGEYLYEHHSPMQTDECNEGIHSPLATVIHNEGTELSQEDINKSQTQSDFSELRMVISHEEKESDMIDDNLTKTETDILLEENDSYKEESDHFLDHKHKKIQKHQLDKDKYMMEKEDLPEGKSEGHQRVDSPGEQKDESLKDADLSYSGENKEYQSLQESVNSEMDEEPVSVPGQSHKDSKRWDLTAEVQDKNFDDKHSAVQKGDEMEDQVQIYQTHKKMSESFEELDYSVEEIKENQKKVDLSLEVSYSEEAYVTLGDLKSTQNVSSGITLETEESDKGNILSEFPPVIIFQHPGVTEEIQTVCLPDEPCELAENAREIEVSEEGSSTILPDHSGEKDEIDVVSLPGSITIPGHQNNVEETLFLVDDRAEIKSIVIDDEEVQEQGALKENDHPQIAEGSLGEANFSYQNEYTRSDLKLEEQDDFLEIKHYTSEEEEEIECHVQIYQTQNENRESFVELGHSVEEVKENKKGIDLSSETHHFEEDNEILEDIESSQQVLSSTITETEASETERDLLLEDQSVVIIKHPGIPEEIRPVVLPDEPCALEEDAREIEMSEESGSSDHSADNNPIDNMPHAVSIITSDYQIHFEESLSSNDQSKEIEPIVILHEEVQEHGKGKEKNHVEMVEGSLEEADASYLKESRRSDLTLDEKDDWSERKHYTSEEDNEMECYVQTSQISDELIGKVDHLVEAVKESQKGVDLSAETDHSDEINDIQEDPDASCHKETTRSDLPLEEKDYLLEGKHYTSVEEEEMEIHLQTNQTHEERSELFVEFDRAEEEVKENRKGVDLSAETGHSEEANEILEDIESGQQVLSSISAETEESETERDLLSEDQYVVIIKHPGVPEDIHPVILPDEPCALEEDAREIAVSEESGLSVLPDHSADSNHLDIMPHAVSTITLDYQISVAETPFSTGHSKEIDPIVLPHEEVQEHETWKEKDNLEIDEGSLEEGDTSDLKESTRSDLTLDEQDDSLERKHYTSEEDEEMECHVQTSQITKEISELFRKIDHSVEEVKENRKEVDLSAETGHSEEANEILEDIESTQQVLSIITAETEESETERDLLSEDQYVVIIKHPGIQEEIRPVVLPDEPCTLEEDAREIEVSEESGLSVLPDHSTITPDYQINVEETLFSIDHAKEIEPIGMPHEDNQNREAQKEKDHLEMTEGSTDEADPSYHKDLTLDEQDDSLEIKHYTSEEEEDIQYHVQIYQTHNEKSESFVELDHSVEEVNENPKGIDLSSEAGNFEEVIEILEDIESTQQVLSNTTGETEESEKEGAFLSEDQSVLIMKHPGEPDEIRSVLLADEPYVLQEYARKSEVSEESGSSDLPEDHNVSVITSDYQINVEETLCSTDHLKEIESIFVSHEEVQKHGTLKEKDDVETADGSLEEVDSSYVKESTISDLTLHEQDDSLERKHYTSEEEDEMESHVKTSQISDVRSDSLGEVDHSAETVKESHERIDLSEEIGYSVASYSAEEIEVMGHHVQIYQTHKERSESLGEVDRSDEVVKESEKAIDLWTETGHSEEVTAEIKQHEKETYLLSEIQSVLIPKHSDVTEEIQSTILPDEPHALEEGAREIKVSEEDGSPVLPGHLENSNQMDILSQPVSVIKSDYQINVEQTLCSPDHSEEVGSIVILHEEDQERVQQTNILDEAESTEKQRDFEKTLSNIVDSPEGGVIISTESFGIDDKETSEIIPPANQDHLLKKTEGYERDIDSSNENVIVSQVKNEEGSKVSPKIEEEQLQLPSFQLHEESPNGQQEPLVDNKKQFQGHLRPELEEEPREEEDDVDSNLPSHGTLDLSAQKSRVILRRKTSIRRRQRPATIEPRVPEPSVPEPTVPEPSVPEPSVPEATAQPRPMFRPLPMGMPVFPGKLPVFARPPPAEEPKDEPAAKEELAVKPKGIPRGAGFGIPHPMMMQELQARLKKKPKQ